MHECQVCKKPVCNFCTEPFDDNEMRRKHKINDPRCIQVQDITKKMETSHTKKRQIPKNYMDTNSLDSQIEKLEAKEIRNSIENAELKKLRNRRSLQISRKKRQ